VAPDVLARKGYDAGRADLWSCGVVLFVLMAGYPPFRDHHMISLVRKIYRAEFRCPLWFSPDLVHLIRAILEPNPNKRIMIQEIMQNHWFKKDFKQISFYVEDNKFYSYDTVEELVPESPLSELKSDNESEKHSLHGSMPSMLLRRVKGGLPTSASSPSLMETYNYESGLRRVPSLNAFDIISFSSGFNLSGLFDEPGEETRFVSCAPVSQIISKLEEIGNAVNFTVRIKDCQVNLDATTGGGDKGPLSISAEISELTPKLVVVEVKKKSGNADDYAKFCNEELKPRLSSLLFDSTSRGSSGSDTD
jgi:serine/threonine protein kinase